jgi:hypothetical protein
MIDSASNQSAGCARVDRQAFFSVTHRSGPWYNVLVSLTAYPPLSRTHGEHMADDSRRFATLYGGGSPPTSPGRSPNNGDSSPKSESLLTTPRQPPPTPQKRPSARRRIAYSSSDATPQEMSAEPTSPRGALLAATLLGPVAMAAAGGLAHALTGHSSPPGKGGMHRNAAGPASMATAQEAPCSVSRLKVITVCVGTTTRELAALTDFVERQQVRDASHCSRFVYSTRVTRVVSWAFILTRTVPITSQPDAVVLQDVLTGEAGQDRAVLGMGHSAALGGGAHASAAHGVYDLFSCRSSRAVRTSTAIMCVSHQHVWAPSL